MSKLSLTLVLVGIGHIVLLYPLPPEPEAWPTDNDEYALRCDPTHSLCRDWVIKVGYENRNHIALPRTAHCEGHDS